MPRSPTTPRVRSFAPVGDEGATVLILGSMPGRASLEAGRYYAHPRNCFWRIMGELVGFRCDAPYEERMRALEDAGIAVWDVLQSCQREGSLDSSIRDETLVANDFAAFFRSHRAVGRVLFNGTKADQCFRRHVLGPGIGAQLDLRRLPSTSPANASWPYPRKLEAWRLALLGNDGPRDAARRTGAGASRAIASLRPA